jgi:hypothetical protein
MSSRARRKRGASRRKLAQDAGFRSAFEWEVARQAEEVGIEFQYEPEGYLIEWQPKTKKYKPDFILPNGIIVETKGRFTVFDRQKHLAIKAQHPELDIRFVFQYDNRLDRRSSTTYCEWCAQKGFICAVGHIPKAWYEE